MQNYKKIILATVVLSIIFFTNQAVSQSVKLNPIKPGVKSSIGITDEQQAILAVRKAKASVVNILGLSKSAPVTPSSGISVSVPIQTEVSGTGIILEADGLIVTNNHVVEGQNMDYWVIMADGKRFPAKILALDKFDDVAFIKIESSGLTPASLGDSDALETGQTVFAIGNSLGRYQNSVTRGVVSALGRALSEADGSAPRIHNLIQTDAAISNGNSGGPLINLAGEVVGLNTLMDTGGYSLNFSIPINIVKESLSQVKAFGKISRPFLGVQFKTIDQAEKLSQNLTIDDGAIISAVSPNTPAALAGLKEGDIVVAVNGQKLGYNNELDSLIQKFQAGSQVTFKILRGTQILEVPVILGEYK